ncbi:MAG: hypothetical protein Q8J78_06770, partial [Moraxellaceae bacterium]|nr:hypothetical protein [Moraxellaceae bacterium]
ELALPGEGQAQVFMAKLQDYVGERTIEELLRDEGIKDGAKRKAGKSEAAPAAPANAAQSLYNEAAEHLHALRITLTDDAALIQLKRKALLELNDSMTQLQKEFSAKVRTALGKTK